MKIPACTNAFAVLYLKPNTDDGSLVLFYSTTDSQVNTIDFAGTIAAL